MYKFLKNSQTRSGKEYSFAVSPIWTPSAFQLSKTLELALTLDNDETCFNVDDCAPPSGPRPAYSPCSTSKHTNDVGRIAISTLSDANLTNNPQQDYELEDGEIRNDEACNKNVSDLEDGEIPDHGDSQSVTTPSKPRHRKREYRQLQKKKKFDLIGHGPKLRDRMKYIGRAVQVDIDIKLPELPFARCGFQAVNKPVNVTKAISSLDELKAEGYAIIEHTPGVSKPIIDSNTRKIFAVAVGAVDDPTYTDSVRGAFEFLKEVSANVEFNENETNHRRGNFTAINYGVSYGQGSRVPHWLNCKHEDLMRKVFMNEHIKRLATFASYAFSMWAPNVFDYYRHRIALLHQKMPSLKWTFYNTIWLCATINFGPHVCCLPHRDFLNLPFGWCAITALGDFDYKKGGHLVLHDLKIAIEFPPGSIILIPSALLTHSNTPIQHGEVRMSFTQFCAGGVFRYIENGFRSEKDLEKVDKIKFAEMQRAKAERRDMGIELWSTIDDLLSPSTM